MESISQTSQVWGSINRPQLGDRIVIHDSWRIIGIGLLQPTKEYVVCWNVIGMSFIAQMSPEKFKHEQKWR